MAVFKSKTRRPHEKSLIIDTIASGTNWEAAFLLTSDQHFDSKNCNRNLLRKHYDQAVDRGAGILILGDFWDAMQGRNDRRGSKKALTEEFLKASYINELVNKATDFLVPYAANIQGWSPGNHETSIIKNLEVDLIDLVISRLKERTGHEINLLPYTGWIIFQVSNIKGSHIGSLRMAYTHGAGGGGPVTKGVIQTNRRATYLPDADIVASGHIHEAWVLELSRERITDHGLPYLDTQWHIQLPTYKEEYNSTGDGWWHETGKSPRPQGGWWLTLGRRKRNNKTWEITINPVRAI